MGYYDISSKQYAVIEPARHLDGAVSGNIVDFPEVFSGVDLKFEYRLANLKETFYLTQRGRNNLPSPRSFGLNDNPSYLVFLSKIDPDARLEAFVDSTRIASRGKGQVRNEPFDYQGEKRVDFKFVSGKLRYFMPEDFALLKDNPDSARAKIQKQKIFRRIESKGPDDLLYAGIPYRWLERMPEGTVVIDPTVGMQPVSGNGKDTFIYKSNGGDDDFGANTGIQTGPDRGTYERRSILQFEIDAIPGNSVITKATLQLYLYSNWGTAADFTIEAHKMLVDWQEGTGATWNNNLTTGADWTYADEPAVQWQSAGMGAGQDYDSAVLSETLIELTDDEVWKSWDVTDAVQNWVDGAANYGLAMVTKSADLSKYIGATFRSSDYTDDPSLCPKLIVEIQVQPLASFDYQYNQGSADLTVTADFANGVTETTNFNSRGFLLDRTYNDGSDLFEFTNQYDFAGNLMQQTFSFNGGAQTTLEFAHDDLYRLKEFKKNAQVERSYTYDDNGNLKTMGSKTFTYGNPGTNQLTSDGTNSYTYDPGGRITRIGSDDTLHYDYRNLMTAYLTPYAGLNDQWNKYDAAGRRVRKSEDLDSRFYLFSGPDVLAEYATDAYPEAEYIFAGGLRIAKVQSKDDTPRPAVSMRAESAGFDDGFYARLYVDGTDYSLNQRGYNLVVIDESGGTVLDQVSYDTYGSTANAEAMADYIDALPHGRIVLAGIKDDGSLNMTENAYLALESLGSVKCRHVGYRDSHAFIGRVGVLPGTVEEEHVPSSSGPAEVEVHKVDCRVQSAGFDDGFLVICLSTAWMWVLTTAVITWW